MHLMLNNFRRHSSKCPHKNKGRAFRQCRCPIWTQGTINGVPVRQALDTRDWKTALDTIHKWEIQGKAEKHMSLEDVCEAFMVDQRARALSKSTLKKYHSDLVSEECQSLIVYASTARVSTIREIGVDFVTAWRAAWECSPITQQKRLERLKVFWRWCVERGYADRNVMLSVRPPKVKQSPTLPFERDEIARLLAAALNQGTKAEGLRLRSYILLCRYTGLRRGDAATLPCASLKGNRVMLRQEKTGEPLYTVLPEAVVFELAGTPRLSSHYWFWTGESDSEIVGGNYGRAFRRLCAKCGIRNGHLHRLRDTFAVEALNSGMQIEDVSKLLGHSSIRVTERHYAPWVKSRQTKLDSAMERMWQADPMVQNWDNSGSMEVKH